MAEERRVVAAVAQRTLEDEVGETAGEEDAAEEHIFEQGAKNDAAM